MRLEGESEAYIVCIKMAVNTVGYIGLGKAGASMASNLPRAGFKLLVRDADPQREQDFAKANKNTTVAEQGADAFGDAEVIVTMLPQGKVVREVLLGENGIAAALKKGVISHGLGDSRPLTTRRHNHRRHIVIIAF